VALPGTGHFVVIAGLLSGRVPARAAAPKRSCGVPDGTGAQLCGRGLQESSVSVNFAGPVLAAGFGVRSEATFEEPIVAAAGRPH